MAEHTPGPWKTWLQQGPMICPLMGPDPHVRVYAVRGRAIGEEEQKANAALIALAPELLQSHLDNVNLDVDAIRREGRLAEVLRDVIRSSQRLVAQALRQS